MKTLTGKLGDLAYCFRHKAYEDAAGHLCDLLELCRQQIKPTARKPFKTIRKLVRYYGRHLDDLDPKFTEATPERLQAYLEYVQNCVKVYEVSLDLPMSFDEWNNLG